MWTRLLSRFTRPTIYQFHLMMVKELQFFMYGDREEAMDSYSAICNEYHRLIDSRTRDRDQVDLVMRRLRRERDEWQRKYGKHRIKVQWPF